MKKWKKILKRTLIAIGVLLLLLLLDILFWLGPTVKFFAQLIGPRALGTPIRIESLDINPRTGTIHLTGLSIANPEMFGTTNAVSLAHLEVALDMGSLLSDTVTVHRVRIDSPHLVFEQSRASDNIAEFIQSLLDFAGCDPADPPEEKKAAKSNDGTKVTRVERLEINDAQFHMVHTDQPALDISLGIEQLNFSMTNGVAELTGLHVTNPNRLTSRSLFTLEGIDVRIDPATFYTPPLTVLELQIRRPYAFIEWAADASTLSEFISIAEATLLRVAEWPLPERTETEMPAEPAEPVPPPVLLKASLSDLRIHLVNSADPQLTVTAGVEMVTAGLSEGDVAVDGIYITNPQRLRLPNLFTLESIDVRFDPDSLQVPPLSVTDVQILRPRLLLEHNRETDTMSELLKIVAVITDSLPTNAPVQTAASTPAAAPASDEPPPVILGRLQVDDIQIQLLDSTSTNRPPSGPVLLAGVQEILADLTAGSAAINQIRVPNPAGFRADDLFHLTGIRVDLDPASLTSGQVVINEVFVNSPLLNLEQTEERGNVGELQDALTAFIPPPANQTPPAPDPAAAAEPSPVPLSEQPLILKQLLITNLVVNASLPAPAVTNATPLSSLHHADAAATNAADAIRLLAFDLLKVMPLEGSMDIMNLRIGNPQGFANENLVGIDRFGIRLDPDTLTADTLIINEIRIRKPRVSYERRIRTDNIKTFQQTIEGAFARRTQTVEAIQEKHNVEADAGQKVIIERLSVESGIVRAKISALPTAPIPLPPIEMRDIGKAEGGAGLAEVSSRIFGTFYDSIIGVVANTYGIAGDALKGAGQLTFDTLGNLTGGLEGILKPGERGRTGTESAEETPKKKRRNLFRDRIHK